MPFGMVSGVCRGMRKRGGDRRRGRGSFGCKCGASHCNQWGLCCIVVRERRALPKLLWRGLDVSLIEVILIHDLLFLPISTTESTVS